MKRIIAIGGEPATGKTTLMRRIMDELPGQWVAFTYGLLRGHVNATAAAIVLGRYEPGETFAGTDRLSNTVINDARKFLAAAGDNGYESFAMLFEGDRLFNVPFIEACAAHAPTVIAILTAHGAQKDERHRLRGDTQSATWLKGKATKMKNIATHFPAVHHIAHEHEQDTANVAEHFVAIVRGMRDNL